MVAVVGLEEQNAVTGSSRAMTVAVKAPLAPPCTAISDAGIAADANIRARACRNRVAELHHAFGNE